MGREIEPDFDQLLLLPPSIEDWVVADDPIRFIREFVRSLDLSEFQRREGAEDDCEVRTDGRPRYSIAVLLGVWLYGYLRKIKGSRELERACRERVQLIWLTGNRAPDHNTLWRFWKAHQKAIRMLFEQTVRVAAECGALSMVLQAVDGTKIQAASSMHTAVYRKRVEKLLRRLESSIALLEREIESAGPGVSDALPAELRDHQELRRRIEEAKAQLDAEDRECLHPGEPEARVMLGGDGRKVLSYNAQLAVDQSGFIVAADVVTAGSDNHQLVPLLEQIHETLGSTAETTVADGGYYSAKTLQESADRGYRVLVREPSDKSGDGKPYSADKFVYDGEHDRCVCPEGQFLTFKRQRRRRMMEVREYRCESFATCPVRFSCSKDKQGRRVEITPAREAVFANRERTRREHEKLKLRAQIVESMIGTIKQQDRLRRFSAKGQENALAEWLAVVTARNLHKLLPLWRAGLVRFLPPDVGTVEAVGASP